MKSMCVRVHIDKGWHGDWCKGSVLGFLSSMVRLALGGEAFITIEVQAKQTVHILKTVPDNNAH